MPISTVPNQGYGKATEQREAQSAVPMGASPVATPEMQSMAQAPTLPRPGEMPYISPTQRPEEPVTAGIAYGPGPGPEALNAVPSLQQFTQNRSSSALMALNDFAARMGM